jgi:hypothetical protein
MAFGGSEENKGFGLYTGELSTTTDISSSQSSIDDSVVEQQSNNNNGLNQSSTAYV